MFICGLPNTLSGIMQTVVHIIVNKTDMIPDLMELKERKGNKKNNK